MALRLVSRTGARHDGQVKTIASGVGGVGAFSTVEAWKWNHSFKQEPQKVCRQSSRVSGWYRRSVHI